jgi:hypothetical protein
MIDLHVLTGVLLAMAALVGATVALSAVMLLAARATGTGRAPHGGMPHGGIRRDLPQQPQPDPDDAQELVLV